MGKGSKFVTAPPASVEGQVTGNDISVLKAVTDVVTRQQLDDAKAHLPKDWNPAKLIEDEAFALRGKITPRALMEANDTLQAQYAAVRDKNPSSPAAYQMIALQDACVKQVRGTNYDAPNASRGGKLTARDREDIAFVKKEPLPAKPAATAPKAPARS